MLQPVFLFINSIIDGSIFPERVPITRPSSGVMPIVVSIEWPSFTAAMLEPFPKCTVIIFKSSIGLFITLATLPETYLWLVPWKPYFLICQSVYAEYGSPYIYASFGIFAWNAVSKTATLGASVSSLHAFIPIMFAG